MLTFKKAQRKKVPGLFIFWGPSGSGKTYSALRFARGLVGPDGKIAVIDTEAGRAEYYAQTGTSPGIGGEWDHALLDPPFTAERFTAAIRQAESMGYNAIVLDSGSHVWGGEGGVLDQAETNKLSGLAKFAGPKIRLKRFVSAITRTTCHVIVCLRAKDGMKQIGKGRDAEIVQSGLTPIMEKGFIFEAMTSICIGRDHKPLFSQSSDFFVDPIIPAIKAPTGIIEHIKPGEYITEQLGMAVAAWLDGGSRDVVAEAERTASRGRKVFNPWHQSLSASDKATLASHKKAISALLDKADADIAAEESGEAWRDAVVDEQTVDNNELPIAGFVPPTQPPTQPPEPYIQYERIAPKPQVPKVPQVPILPTLPPQATQAPQQQSKPSVLGLAEVGDIINVLGKSSDGMPYNLSGRLTEATDTIIRIIEADMANGTHVDGSKPPLAVERIRVISVLEKSGAQGKQQSRSME